MLFTSEWNPGNFSGDELHEIRIEVVPEVGVPETTVRQFCLGRCRGIESLGWLPWLGSLYCRYFVAGSMAKCFIFVFLRSLKVQIFVMHFERLVAYCEYCSTGKVVWYDAMVGYNGMMLW